MSDYTSLEQSIELVTGLIAKMESQAFQQEGFSELSMRQVFYLDAIIRLGHPSFSELAETLSITRPSVTAIVGRLILKGYVQKVQDDEDRRSFHIILTQKGKEFDKVHKNIHQLVAQALTKRLSGVEIEQLTALLQKAVGG
jgi:DNA-binding MarR family transcriptional regulator